MQDAPLREWMGYESRSGYREEYLLEDLRLEGRGSAANELCSCGESDANGLKERLYRCEDCFGLEMTCAACCAASHRQLPLHVIKKWNGSSFEQSSLKEIGLRVQLGHSDLKCVCPERGHVDFIVIHVNGIHHVNVDFCGCDQCVSHRQQLLRCDWYPATIHFPQTACTRRVLEYFLVMTWSSKVSGHEFYMTLERLTDNVGLNIPNSQYRAFMRTIRQFRHIRMMKQAGRGNVGGGIASTEPGALAVQCPACPHPGINLPGDWEQIDVSLKFLYAIFLALDANFRLKNRLRSSKAGDPGLHTGLAYFVPNEPYRAHILNNASQNDISSCSGFKTLAHAETKFSNGLRATGVGLCLCARHEFVRPVGVGDLQKGERYANMDYIFFSTITPLLLLSVVISYDIACQWKLNLLKRMLALPEDIQIPVVTAVAAFLFAVPKFHAPAHEEKCSTPHSLNLMPGVGRTDGEGIERNWAEMNCVANSTKEMGPCSRHDTLDDHFRHHNWRKLTGLGLSLRKKLLLALKENRRQREMFAEFDAAIDAPQHDEWLAMILAWESDKAQSNPYLVLNTNLTEAQMHAAMAEEEKDAIVSGRVLPHETSPSAFIHLGFSIEDTQRHVKNDAERTSSLSSDQESDLHHRRAGLHRQICRFRKIQNVYMLGINEWVEQHSVDQSPHPEDVELWLPSALNAQSRSSMCRYDIEIIESELRKGQCRDALDKMRNLLRTKTHFVKRRNLDIRGQRANTRACALIDCIDDKYTKSRKALLTLIGEGDWVTELQLLLPRHIVGPHDPLEEEPSSRTIRREQDMQNGLGEGFHVTLWIWTTRGVLGDNSDALLNDAVRVEWAKARARSLRWSEEVLLLKEEMRQVRQYLDWRAQWWEARAELDHHDKGIVEGARAYAYRQSAIQRALLSRFTALWEAQSAFNQSRKFSRMFGGGVQDSNTDNEPFSIQADGAEDEDEDKVDDVD
ncbi:uncharacterized protein F5891DRAFT_1127683 [Suillus fuscotomentosus]|uniref:CxC2-like cysteine cluster KDZ transposase-associated domain-containing protein n=1 Tax=Suillus fuscotomentosus TaxID=1912939 RepID=A0AAD4E9W3_9AGAM|nr:uncharacterized protein F5891DRAFT_1127683 [Suillus fuscotomentosus]KAG1902395.1 hypothetical protein F5891DRAFT_1127683 [Suillus fuscotomentosus]